MRTRPRTVLVLLAGLFALALSLTAAEPAWHDTTRDVYVDGRLDRAVQVLSTENGKRLAVVLPGERKALLLDREAGTFATVARKEFAMTPDGAAADLAADARTQPAGMFQKVDAGSTILSWKGRTILVARHQGIVGDVSEETLFAAVPVWRRLMDAYQPAPAAVTAAASEKRDVKMTIVFGSWCGDSKEFVPHLVKTLHRAANPRIHLQLVALDNQFLHPQDVI